MLSIEVNRSEKSMIHKSPKLNGEPELTNRTQNIESVDRLNDRATLTQSFRISATADKMKSIPMALDKMLNPKWKRASLEGPVHAQKPAKKHIFRCAAVWSRIQMKSMSAIRSGKSTIHKSFQRRREDESL
jgi:hypothetical protein